MNLVKDRTESTVTTTNYDFSSSFQFSFLITNDYFCIKKETLHLMGEIKNGTNLFQHLTYHVSEKQQIK